MPQDEIKISGRDLRVIVDALAIAMAISFDARPAVPCDFANQAYEDVHSKLSETLQQRGAA